MTDSTATTLFGAQERKDIISPGTGERYFVNYSWQIDATTLLPVGVKVEETH
jgi:hypothetical protein